jgi:hypothetical protein
MQSDRVRRGNDEVVPENIIGAIDEERIVHKRHDDDWHIQDLSVEDVLVAQVQVSGI